MRLSTSSKPGWPGVSFCSLSGVLFMPYVQRNFVDKLVGIYSCSQPGVAEEFLPDDAPEIVAFNLAHPIPPGFLIITPEQIEKATAQHAIALADGQKLKDLTLAFLHQWANLETALSALFYVIVNCESKSSHIAYAIYYALGGFDARIGVVSQAIQQLFAENPELRCAAKAWGAINQELKDVKSIRNQVAHGTILTINSGGRQFTRLTSPPFDPNKIGRPLMKGPEVGLSPKQLNNHLLCIPLAMAAIDGISRLIADYREFGAGPLPQRLAELEALQNLLGSPRRDTPTQAKP
jgi:hypothetical protein